MTTKTDTRKAVYRQDVRMTVSVLVSGTMDQFNVDTEDFQARIEKYVRGIFPSRIRFDEFYASTLPGSTRFYFPEDVEGAGYGADDLAADRKRSISVKFEEV